MVAVSAYPHTRVLGSHRRRARLCASVAAITLALALGACATDDDDAALARAAESSASAAPSGPGPLTIATSFGIDDIDPRANSFWGPEFGYVELLMRPEPDGNPSPWVLDRLTSVDPTTWKLTLNDGVKFENGKNLDGPALAELIEYCNEEVEGFEAAVNLDKADSTGPLEVTLTTTEPVPGMANLLADEANVPVFDVAGYRATWPGIGSTSRRTASRRTCWMRGSTPART